MVVGYDDDNGELVVEMHLANEQAYRVKMNNSGLPQVYTALIGAGGGGKNAGVRYPDGINPGGTATATGQGYGGGGGGR